MISAWKKVISHSDENYKSILHYVQKTVGLGKRFQTHFSKNVCLHCKACNMNIWLLLKNMFVAWYMQNEDCMWLYVFSWNSVLGGHFQTICLLLSKVVWYMYWTVTCSLTFLTQTLATASIVCIQNAMSSIIKIKSV